MTQAGRTRNCAAPADDGISALVSAGSCASSRAATGTAVLVEPVPSPHPRPDALLPLLHAALQPGLRSRCCCRTAITLAEAAELTSSRQRVRLGHAHHGACDGSRRWRRQWTSDVAHLAEGAGSKWPGCKCVPPEVSAARCGAC